MKSAETKYFACDEWLGGIIGRPVFRLTGAATPATELARLPKGAFVYAKVPAAELGAIHSLEDLGFRVVDTAVTLHGEPQGEEPHPDGFRLAEAEAGEQEAVSRLAGNCFSFTRFHADPKVGRQNADKIKREWASNFFKGQRGDAMVVARDGGEVTGFLQLIFHGGDLVIDLIGVAPGRQGKGLGRAMSLFAWHNLGEFKRVVVGTQAANAPALGLYQSLGLKVKSLQYILHWHGSGVAK